MHTSNTFITGQQSLPTQTEASNTETEHNMREMITINQQDK